MSEELELFPFDVHTTTWSFPKGDGFKFGRGYSFSAGPQLPIQRTITLSFEAMLWLRDEDEEWSAEAEPLNLNIWALLKFYERHHTWKNFRYSHPILGELIVKFAPDSPLEIPKSRPGGSGATTDFTITLLEMPL